MPPLQMVAVEYSRTIFSKQHTQSSTNRLPEMHSPQEAALLFLLSGRYLLPQACAQIIRQHWRAVSPQVNGHKTQILYTLDRRPQTVKLTPCRLVTKTPMPASEFQQAKCVGGYVVRNCVIFKNSPETPTSMNVEATPTPSWL